MAKKRENAELARLTKESKKRLLADLKHGGWLKTPRVIKAFEAVPRELFVRAENAKEAYWDVPLPIGFGQTISQPLTVAFMTELLKPQAGQKILEIGTGSGYQAAILSKVVGPKGKVITLEIVPQLVEFAIANLQKAGIKNVEVHHSDGSQGWPDDAPYDRIIATAAAPEIPRPLKEQLKVGGVLVVPVGTYLQKMMRVTRRGPDQFEIEDHGEFRFVPLRGRHGF